MSFEYMTQIVRDVGQEVTIKKITGSVNKWGDKDTTVDDSVTVDVVVEEIDEGIDESAEGDVQTADYRIFLPSDTDYVSRGNIITIDGSDYKIDEVMQHSKIGQESHLEARVETV